MIIIKSTIVKCLPSNDSHVVCSSLASCVPHWPFYTPYCKFITAGQLACVRLRAVSAVEVRMCLTGSRLINHRICPLMICTSRLHLLHSETSHSHWSILSVVQRIVGLVRILFVEFSYVEASWHLPIFIMNCGLRRTLSVRVHWVTVVVGPRYLGGRIAYRTSLGISTWVVVGRRLPPLHI